MMRMYFTLKESFQNILGIPIGPEEQNLTNGIFTTFIVIEISLQQVIKEASSIIVLLY